MKEQQNLEAELTRDLQKKLLSDCEDDDLAENRMKGDTEII